MSTNPGMGGTAHDPFTGPALSARLPLTEAQREVWLTCELEPAITLAFNECGRLTLRGPLKVPALLASLQTLVDRHEALRSNFSPDGQWMVVAADQQADVKVLDVSADPANLIHRCEQHELGTPFDLAKGPLIRWHLLRESETVHHLVRTAHHAIFDGWSAWVVSSELGKLYSAAVEGREAGLTEPAPRYGDYAQTEREFVHSGEGQQHLDYWLRLLENPPTPADIPHDLPRPRERSYAARRVDIAFDATLVGQLRKLGATQNASLVATTLAAFAATLHRQTGVQDVIVALAAAGQSFHQYNGLVGHAVNLLPLRFTPKPEQLFTELLAETRTAVLDAFDHQGASFGGIVPQLQFERDHSRPPLISAIFNIDVRSGDVVFSGLETIYRVLERKAEVFDLFINMVDNGRELVLEASYNCALFSEESIRARMAEYERVLRAVCDAPATPLAQLPLLDEASLARLTAPPRLSTPQTYLVHERFAQMAALHPQREAVQFENGTLSYAELDARANQLAHALQARGVGPEVLVGLYLERSLDAVVALLAILKAGGAYLPMDTVYPADRVAYMLQDSRATLVLTHSSLRDKLPAEAATLSLDTEWDAQVGQHARTAPPCAATVDSLIYVIYTSGSTGQPKGCQLTHANVSRLFTSTDAWFGFSEQDVWTLFHSIAFDFSVWEVWGALLHGGKLVVVPYWAAREPDKFLQLLAEQRVTVLNQTPSAFRQLIQADLAASPAPALVLRCVVFGGEALEFQSLKPWFERHGDGTAGRGPTLVNMYGITETTVHVTYRPVRLADLTGESAPSVIGEPIPDLSLYVLDGKRQPVPPGVTGEMWVGGAGVARGYLNRPELTAERFIDDPFNPAQRLYKSGDLARWLAGGELEYLGRIDHQVKLRGFRIELGEIEAQLARHAEVAEVFVNVIERSAGDARLVAWLVPRGDTLPTASVLRTHLRGNLPDYMLPQHFVELARFPLTNNGKLDRKALPSPFAQDLAPVAKIAPRTPAEKAIAAIWSEVLGVKDIGIEDRFADLGGHSLLAVQTAARIHSQLGVKPPLRGVMMDPLSVIAAQVSNGTPPAPAAPVPAATKPVPAKPGLPPPSPTLLMDIHIPTRQSADRKSGGWLGKLFGK